MKKTLFKFVSIATAAILFTSCAAVQQNLVEDNSYQRTKTGALLGALTGAVVGATTSKKKLKGALIGAAAGAAVGGGIGYLLDEQANAVARALGTHVANDPLALVDPNRDIVVVKGDRYVRILFRDKMMFPFNSDQMRPSAMNKVAKLAAVLRRYPQTIVQVAGFTDSVGSYDYNYQLSLRRAQNVANFLRNQGVSNKILVRGCSYNKPLVPNKSPQARALNRRVEVYLYNSTADITNPCY